MSQAKRVPRLSKSRYISGKQCHLRLWNECFAPELAAPADDAQQAIFDLGHQVGELATQRYPGGEMIEEDYLNTEAALQHTQRALEGDSPALFEAAFQFRGVLCRIDVLVRAPGGLWDVVEVKSTGSAKDVHVADLAIQVWIAQGAGIKVRHAGVLTLNTGYVYQGGELDLRRLFRLHDKTIEVAAQGRQIARDVEDFKDLLSAEEAPRVSPGPHCHAPYDCQFLPHCMKDIQVPEHPLQQLPSMQHSRIAAWGKHGVEDILLLPEDAELTSLQERVRTSLVSGQPYRSPELAAALKEPRYPVHHLDFETFMPLIPRYRGTRPFQALPFQWSNHIEQADGRLEHHEFLSTEDVDPRPACAAALLASLGTEGSIVTYSPYEARVIRELMLAVPEHKEALGALLARVWDLLPVIKQHYYHPGFRGSYSLKAVFPALVPDMSYQGLEIGEGGTAQREYSRMLASEDEAERARIRQALLRYCSQDTLALVKLRKALAEEAGNV